MRSGFIRAGSCEVATQASPDGLIDVVGKLARHMEVADGGDALGRLVLLKNRSH